MVVDCLETSACRAAQAFGSSCAAGVALSMSTVQPAGDLLDLVRLAYGHLVSGQTFVPMHAGKVGKLRLQMQPQSSL